MQRLTQRQTETLIAHLRGPRAVDARELTRLRTLENRGFLKLRPHCDRPRRSRLTRAGAFQIEQLLRARPAAEPERLEKSEIAS